MFFLDLARDCDDWGRAGFYSFWGMGGISRAFYSTLLLKRVMLFSPRCMYDRPVGMEVEDGY